MKGEMGDLLMYGIGAVVLVILVSSVIMPQVFDNSGYVYEAQTAEGLGYYRADLTANQTFTVANVPLKTRSTIIVYQNATAGGTDAGEALAHDAYNVTLSTGTFTFGALADSPDNQSYISISYTGATQAWDTATTAIWGIIALAIAAFVIIFLLSL